MDQSSGGKRLKLGTVSGVYIPVCLNIFSILLFLRFGMILGQIGLLGMLGNFHPRGAESLGSNLANHLLRSTGYVLSGWHHHYIQSIRCGLKW